MLLTREQIQQLIEGTWAGDYASTRLPAWLLDLSANGLLKAAAEGWGNVLGTGTAIRDIALEKSFIDNILFFAANKNAHQLKDMQEIMTTSKGKFDFVKQALAVNEKYNKHWYETEYTTTNRLARSGREWQEIQTDKDIFPLLQFVAVLDGNTRNSHATLNGITRPVDDAFWSTYQPPLDWNCRCRIKRLKRGTETPLDGMPLPTVEEQFSTRVTDSRKLWSEKHPYFQGLDKAEKKEVARAVERKKKREEADNE